MILLTIAGGVVAAVLLVPVISDVVSCVRAAGHRRRSSGHATDLPRFLVLVPAHDEALLIGSCVRAIGDLDYPSERVRVVVVADNCTDDTAGVAAQAGATVLVRQDDARRGKPLALAWAFDRLDLLATDAVVLVDADSIVDRDFLQQLARRAPLNGKAVQPFNHLRNPTDTALTRMAAVLSTIYFRLLYPLKQRAGLNVPLGNGMCLGASLLRQHGWTAFSLAEDTELYFQLTLANYRIEVEPRAVIRAQEARTLSQSGSQRERWRAGRLAILARNKRALMHATNLSLHQRFDMVAELVIPGPVVQLGVCALVGLLLVVLAPPASAAVVLLLSLPIVRLVTLSGIAIAYQESPARTLAAFLFLPFYLVWRMLRELLTIRSLLRRSWIRTARHGEPAG